MSMNLCMEFKDNKERVVHRVDLPQIDTEDTYKILGISPKKDNSVEVILKRLKNYLREHPNKYMISFINDINEDIKKWSDDYTLIFTAM